VTATQPITHAQLGELLASLRFGVDPSDLHGSLTGYLCAGGKADARGWLAALQVQTDAAETAAAMSSAPLQQLFRECSAWLDDPDEPGSCRRAPRAGRPRDDPRTDSAQLASRAQSAPHAPPFHAREPVALPTHAAARTHAPSRR